MARVEKKTSKKKRKKSFDYKSLYDKLFNLYGECTCPLVHNSPFQLLCAVMLSVFIQLIEAFSVFKQIYYFVVP